MRNDPQGRAIQIGQYSGAPTTLSLGIASASVTLSPDTYYRIWSSVDAFFQFGNAGVVATTNSHPATAKLDYLHFTDSTNFTLAAIVSSGSGTLFISQINTQF